MASPHPDADLSDAIKGLPDRQHQAIVLYYMLDLPVAEVAIIMQCAPGTVRASLFAARAGSVKLSEVMQDDRTARPIRQADGR